MKKLLFLIISVFLLTSVVVAKNEPLELVSLVNKCVVVKDNVMVIPVQVISKNDGSLTTLINQYTLGYVYNSDDEVSIKVTDVKGVSNVIIDTEKTNDGLSLVRYYINEDINSKKNSLVFSFNLQVEFKNEIPDSYYALGNEVVLGNDDLCHYINGYEIKESVRVDYKDLTSVDHTEMIEDIITWCIIGILVIVIIILTVVLIRKKK